MVMGCSLAAAMAVPMLIALLSFPSIGSAQPLQFAAQPFPAFFIFGDSIVDVGNNNYIITIARANSLPFGIDFPAGPTGRFTNGKTVLDVVAEFLNLPLVPPYLGLKARSNSILKGVNYASGAGGILEKTGFNYIGRIDFDTQLDWFENTIGELQELLGPSAAQNLIANSLFAVVMGSNDYINNYLLSASASSKQYTPPQFQDLLLNKFSSQLMRLYNLGARKIGVANIGPLGCIPSQLAAQKSPDGSCSQNVNSLVLNYNNGLKSLLQQLNVNEGARFVYADIYNPVLDYRTNLAKYGFVWGSEACCGLGKYKGQFPCAPLVKPCPNRDAYVFWDAFHPSQKANILLGNYLYQRVATLLLF